MGTVFFYSPHPDDEVLSMGLAMVHYAAAGFDVHLVSMNRGGNGGPLSHFNGLQTCGWHGYTHNPAEEGYAPLTDADIAEARFREARSALGAISTIAGATGTVYHHDGGLPDGFGGTAGQPPTVSGITAAKAAIEPLVSAYPNAFHHTMSPTDNHPDHAACGTALRELKQSAEYGAQLTGARFFVSRLYWDYSKNPDVLAENPSWFPATASRKAEFDQHLRTRVAPIYSEWNPAEGSYAIGYHQVVNQFAANFGPAASIANLWHA